MWIALKERERQTERQRENLASFLFQEVIDPSIAKRNGTKRRKTRPNKMLLIKEK